MIFNIQIDRLTTIIHQRFYLAVIFVFRWLFDSGKLDKKFDFFQCIVDPELLPTDAEEMKPMRDGDANTYNSTEGGESVVAPVVVSFCLYFGVDIT